LDFASVPRPSKNLVKNDKNMKILSELSEKAEKLLGIRKKIREKRKIAIRTWFHTRNGKRCIVKWVDEEEHLKKIG